MNDGEWVAAHSFFRTFSTDREDPGRVRMSRISERVFDLAKPVVEEEGTLPPTYLQEVREEALRPGGSLALANNSFCAHIQS